MQIHGPSAVIDRVDVERYHPGAVALAIGGTEAVMRLVTYSAADCDEIIKAAIQAKSMHLSETSEPAQDDAGRAIVADLEDQRGDGLYGGDWRDDGRDYAEEAYNRRFCDACGSSPCTWDGVPDGFHTDEDAEQPGACGHTRRAYGACVREPVHPGWHRNVTGEEWPQYTEDRDLDAILNGPGYRLPAIELAGGAA